MELDEFVKQNQNLPRKRYVFEGDELVTKEFIKPKIDFDEILRREGLKIGEFRNKKTAKKTE